MESMSYRLTDRQFGDLADRFERRRIELIVEFERRKAGERVSSDTDGGVEGGQADGAGPSGRMEDFL